MAGASLVGVDVPAMMSCIGSSAVGPLAKMAVAFPLSYHFLGGLRHIVRAHCSSLSYVCMLWLRVSMLTLCLLCWVLCLLLQYWDRTPSALLIKETKESSYAIFGAAGIFSLIAAFL